MKISTVQLRWMGAFLCTTTSFFAKNRVNDLVIRDQGRTMDNALLRSSARDSNFFVYTHYVNAHNFHTFLLRVAGFWVKKLNDLWANHWTFSTSVWKLRDFVIRFHWKIFFRWNKSLNEMIQNIILINHYRKVTHQKQWKLLRVSTPSPNRML